MSSPSLLPLFLPSDVALATSPSDTRLCTNSHKETSRSILRDSLSPCLLGRRQYMYHSKRLTRKEM